MHSSNQNKTMKTSALIAIVLFACLFSNRAVCQWEEPEVCKLKNKRVVVTGSERETLAQLKEIALDKLKREAIRETVGETIRASQVFVQQETENRLNEVFLSQVTSEAGGYVRNIRIKKATPSFNEYNQIVLEILADCEVLKYRSKPDPNLTAHIKGVESVYSQKEDLLFSITPAMACFVKVFLISEVEGESALLYPNAYETSRKLEAGKTITFPSNPSVIKYELYATQSQEANILFVVLLKEDYPFVNIAPTKEKILDWIFSIEPSARNAISHNFIIRK